MYIVIYIYILREKIQSIIKNWILRRVIIRRFFRRNKVFAKDNELFNKIIIEKILECEKVIGEKDAKLLQNIEKFGGVEACRNVLKRRQYSKCFNKLKDKDRLDLSM